MLAHNEQLKDFIYLDIDRVRSFVAQMYAGVPEAFEETEGHDKAGKGKANVGIPGIVSLDIGGNILYQKSSTETRSAHHYLYNLFEKKIDDLGKLLKVDSSFQRENWTKDTFRDGLFVLIQGRVRIIDYRSVVASLEMIPRIAEISLIFQKQTLKQRLHDGKINQSEYSAALKAGELPQQINRKDIQQIAEMVEKLYSGSSSIKAFPFHENNNYFIGKAAFDYYTTESVKSFTSGLLSGKSWFVMGIINSPSEDSSGITSDNMEANLDEALEQVVFGLQTVTKFTFSVKFPVVSITPIAIYRPC